MRWYQYQFGATIDNNLCDNIGGNFWIPFSNNIEKVAINHADFQYYIGTQLLPEQYTFSEDATTIIKAVLCQEGYNTEVKEFTTGNTLYSKKVTTATGVRAIFDNTITFTNALFTRNEERATEYLRING